MPGPPGRTWTHVDAISLGSTGGQAWMGFLNRDDALNGRSGQPLGSPCCLSLTVGSGRQGRVFGPRGEGAVYVPYNDCITRVTKEGARSNRDP